MWYRYARGEPGVYRYRNWMNKCIGRRKEDTRILVVVAFSWCIPVIQRVS